jgi:hypothetical protein
MRGAETDRRVEIFRGVFPSPLVEEGAMMVFEKSSMIPIA